ncbi:MAG: RNA polymerase sigma factor [Planctomycetota bacterium]
MLLDDDAKDDDAKLVRQWLAGDMADYEAVVARFQAPIFRFAYNLLGDREEAEDVAQEVFVAAYRHREQFDPRRARFSTWLFTIARHRCINSLKKKKLDTVAFDEFTADRPPGLRVEERTAFWESLDRALAALPWEQRTVFVLAEIEQLAYAEIAEIEKTSLGTIKSRLHRAKRALRAALEPMGRAR